MDEYLSIAGNGGGGLDEFWRVIYQHSRLMGGAIWDFVSPGLTEPVRRLEDLSPSQTPVHIMGNARLVAGQDGQALDLNGHDQWVEVYRADQVEIEGEQLSLLMEVLPRKLNSSAGSFLTKGNYQFGLKQNGTETLDFYLYTGEKHLLSTPLPADWENNWHQLLATYDGANMRIYIDGQEVATETASGSIQNLPFPVNIGRNAEQHGQNTKVYLCDALIDNVGIFAQVLTPAAEPNPAEALLWLDFEQETQEGSFFSYGIGARTYGAIWPDRRPQAEMWQMKKSAQPLACSLLDLENGLLEVWNRSNFAHAEVWQTSWTLTEDEKVLQSGVLDLNLGPQSRRTEVLPLNKPAIVPGREYRLNISSVLKADKLWAPAGFEVSWDQFELTDWNLPAPKNTGSGGEISLSEDGGHFVVSGEGFRYQLHRESGALVSMQVDENELLVSPLKLNVWRAPIANELDQWNGGTMRSPRWLEGWGGTMATDYYANGIHDLKQVPLAVEAIETEEKVIVKVRELALTHGGTRPYTIGDRYSDGQTLNGFESFYTYTFLGDGSLTIDHEVKPQGSMPQMLPRMGLTLMLDSQLQQVAWYGRGPQENYPDRKSGYRLGLYQASVPDLYEPYLIPQDHGLRTDNRWLQMTNEEGQGLAFSMDEPFNFNAYPYTTKNLTRALYPFQLQAATGITLNLDYQTTGVGGTARPVMDAYRVYPQAFRRQIRLVPLR
jgi:beta-galactosidase